MILLSPCIYAAKPISNDFSYEIKNYNPDAIICEPLIVEITATYKGITPVEAWPNNTVFVNNEKMTFNACLHGRLMGDISKRLIKQGDSFTMGENLRCYPPFWKPGRYVVYFEQNNDEATVLRTPSFEIKISEPTGIDKQLYDYAQSKNPPDSKMCQKDQNGNCRKDLWSPCITWSVKDQCFEKISWNEIATKYPTSCYAAWIYNNYIGNITIGNPQATVVSIKKNNYHDGNSVPCLTAKDGWEGLRGSEYFKWENEKSLEIIASCPRFPHKDKLIVVTAVNNIVLGKESEGIRMLKELIRTSSSREANWARQFLEEWEKQKPRQ